MKTHFSDLRSIDFVPLSEVKAKLSEFIRRLSGEKRIVLTTNGRPTAAILSYADYLDLLNRVEGVSSSQGKSISLEEWRKDRKKREMIRDSVLGLFDPASLSRKGQKGYKQKMVSSLHGRS